MPFIEGNLPEAKQLEFVMHMRNCKACHDELEIYYTLMTGMQVLSNGEASTGNFGRDLEVKLKKIEHRAKSRKNIRLSAFTIITVAIGLFMVFFYGRCLTRVYAFEQQTKQTAQGEYYFLKKLGDKILPIEDRIVLYNEKAEEEKDATPAPEIFNKVHGYQELEEYSKQVIELGGKITHEKITAD